MGSYAKRLNSTDVLFVDVPHDFRRPESSWCLGYRYMVSALRAEGFSARVLHPPRGGANIRRRLIEEIVKARAAVVGFTTYDAQLAPLLELIGDLRAAGLRAHVTLGGFCASVIPELILREHAGVDSIVVGEGETSIVDLARQIRRGGAPRAIPGIHLRDGVSMLAGEPRPVIEDLDTLPGPALDDFTVDGECTPMRLVNNCVPVLGSRGCYGRCTFCSIQRVYRSCPGKPWRGLSAGRVVEEVVRLAASTGCDSVTFVDENFMGPGRLGRRHAADVAEGIAKSALPLKFNFGCRANDVDGPTMEALKRSGLAAVSLGVESMSAETLTLFNKGISPETNNRALDILEALDLFVEITFIFFHPLTTLQDIRTNLGFVENVRNRRYTYFNNHRPMTEFIPFFGTELTNYFAQRGLVQRTLHGYSTTYADDRVGFIAERVAAVPVDTLAALRNMLPSEASGVGEALRGCEVRMTMERLPELVSDLCGLFDRGLGIASDPVQRAAQAFDQEAERIRAMAARFVAHVQ